MGRAGGQQRHAAASLAVEQSQVRAWPDDNPNLAHEHDHRDWIYDHHHRTAERAAEQALDQLNPDFEVPTEHCCTCRCRACLSRSLRAATSLR